ncbi:hypothetical protein [Halomarina litorea]|uniref:hypothetical protein n=1 Tax=Halomarina litorea TaxID=2961595 RepID=UPI0020C557C6|nr:hypothetical protein [Halomarina sp. BCD28]
MHDPRAGVSRRHVLASAGGAFALPALSGIATAQQSNDYGPLGRVKVDGTKEVVVEGDTAYLATTSGFATVDVSDPASPALLADRRDLLADREDGPLRMIYDVKVSGENLLVVGPANGVQDAFRGAVLYDVSDPADPTERTVYETDFAIHNAYLDGTTAYLTGNDGRGNPLVAVDVAAGEELGRWSPADEDEAWLDVYPGFRSLHDVYVQDGVAYLPYWDAGTWMVDVSDPTDISRIAKVRGPSPEELASRNRLNVLEPPGNDHYVTVNEDASLLAIGMESWDYRDGDGSGGPSGIDLYDVSDPENAERLSTITPPPAENDNRQGGVWTTSHNLDVAEDRVYASWYQGGVQVFDISDPSAPALLRGWADRDAASFWGAASVTPGEFFVASSTDYRGKTAALFTFPDAPADERSTRTQTSTPTDTPAPNGTTGNDTNGSNGSGTTSAPTTNGTATTAPAGNTTEDTSSSDGPGFGVAAGLAGLGLGAWRALRRE